MRNGEISFGNKRVRDLVEAGLFAEHAAVLADQVAPTDTNPGTVSSFSISPTMMVLLP